MISHTRRTILMTIGSLPIISACTPMLGNGDATDIQADFSALEAQSGGRLGVTAINTADNLMVKYRANERFPMCSTFKALVAGAILHRRIPLDQRISYTTADLKSHSPITEKYVATGMTVGDLCAATIQYSDNAAANLLMAQIGGPEGITAFVRSLGDTETRLDRWETELNSAIPGDVRDTTTPLAMAKTLEILAVGDALKPDARTQLQIWLRGNTTGSERIRAGVPANWIVGDKTGTGSYGATNDIAVLWPPKQAPIIMTLYFVQPDKDAKARNDVLVAATKLVTKILA